MLFQSKEKLRVIDVVDKTSKKGNSFTVVTLGDPSTFENMDLLIEDHIAVTDADKGKDYLFTVDLKKIGYQLNGIIKEIKR